MKKNIRMIYITEFLLLFLIIIFYLLTNVISSNLKSYLAITFLLVILIPNAIFFGIKNTKNYYSGYILRIVLTVLMISGIVLYLLGIVLGFNHGYLINANNIIYSIIPIIVIVVISEYLRYIIVKHSYTNIKAVVVFTLLLSCFQILLELNPRVLSTSYDRFVFICTIVMPIVAENFLCSYLVYHSDVSSSILFKLIVELYMYVIPIVPDLGHYIYAASKVIIPYIIFYIVNKNLLQQEESKRTFADNNKRILIIPVVIFAIVLVILVSGIFKYKLIAVASNSMADIFYRGDAVILEYTEPDEIEIGDILVFTYEGKVITHRVIGIEKVNSKLMFNTKGDANDSPDGFITSEDEVIGKVDYVIKYIGFPTLWANELFRKG